MAEAQTPIPKSVRFHYIKSSQFRVVFAEGGIGGITPNGMIHLALFNERPAIPREMVHTVNPDGTLGGVEESVGREGVVREMEVDLMLNLAAAKRIQVWLAEKIALLERRTPVN